MARRDDSEPLACALAIGGLDPGGGAGLAADLRAFGRAGAFGCAVAAVLTVQSTSGLRAAHAVRTKLVLEQAREVLSHQRVGAIKTGALGTSANLKAVAHLLAEHPRIPVVVDPVMMPTRGSGRLLAERALGALRRELLPRATLVTANVPEAEAITGARILDVEAAARAAVAIRALGAHAVLVKGGHLAGPESIDVLCTEKGTTLLASKRLKLPSGLHGGGCTLASLIAGRLALGDALLPAVKWAKKVHAAALALPRDVGGELRVLAV
ncbi:MAG: Phosphomethylpyrimidine kinase [Myxococcaceae bacterium]|nr:Phosphomethylpyrimidine kinase [Myxococcaceae bacterium]